ncbi:MAG: hypothetical protein JWL92_583 [Candidatus Nomurabacteria bacterium]|nr:hypothetical protein [Candidatus Nomurabacteria bacterium]
MEKIEIESLPKNISEIINAFDNQLPITIIIKEVKYLLLIEDMNTSTENYVKDPEGTVRALLLECHTITHSDELPVKVCLHLLAEKMHQDGEYVVTDALLFKGTLKEFKEVATPFSKDDVEHELTQE